MTYDSFDSFQAGLANAHYQHYDDHNQLVATAFSRAQADILYRYYLHARGYKDASGSGELVLGNEKKLRKSDFMAANGSAFEGGQLLITPAGANDVMGKKQGRKWSIALNDSFILGGIHGHKPFFLSATPDELDDLDRVDENSTYTLSVTQREVIGLVKHGYARGANPGPEGITFTLPPENARLADNATFASYLAEVRDIVMPLTGHDAVITRPDRPFA